MTSLNCYINIQLAKLISSCFDLRNILLSNQTNVTWLLIITLIYVHDERYHFSFSLLRSPSPGLLLYVLMVMQIKLVAVVATLKNPQNEVVSKNCKNNYHNHPFFLIISRQPVCDPVNILLDYCYRRGFHDGPLFLTIDSSVSKKHLTENLTLTIKYCGLDRSRYKVHSFWIGAASCAADRVLSDSPKRSKLGFLACRLLKLSIAWSMTFICSWHLPSIIIMV